MPRRMHTKGGEKSRLLMASERNQVKGQYNKVRSEHKAAFQGLTLDLNHL